MHHLVIKIITVRNQAELVLPLDEAKRSLFSGLDLAAGALLLDSHGFLVVDETQNRLLLSVSLLHSLLERKPSMAVVQDCVLVIDEAESVRVSLRHSCFMPSSNLLRKHCLRLVF
mmetsp:Transcript_10834/g.13649  ORF Transcript_10834/g.13649 Transcript_10834/m.13649 type:complete len:115 (+) Transcript_10834:250-594(+)